MRVKLTATTTAELDVEAILGFADQTIIEPARTWHQASHRQKLVFQGCLFPKGVTFDSAEFRTPLTASFLAGLRDLERAETRMASLMSPSSNFSTWITRIGVLREGLKEAA